MKVAQPARALKSVVAEHWRPHSLLGRHAPPDFAEQ